MGKKKFIYITLASNKRKRNNNAENKEKERDIKGGVVGITVKIWYAWWKKWCAIWTKLYSRNLRCSCTRYVSRETAATWPTWSHEASYRSTLHKKKEAKLRTKLNQSKQISSHMLQLATEKFVASHELILL